MPQKSISFFWVLLVILLVFCGLCILKSPSRQYSVFNRTWGFDHILFYGIKARILFFFVCFILILPYTNRWLRMLFSRIADLLPQTTGKKLLLFALLSAISALLFYLLSVKYYFLGDFNLRLIQTMKKEFLATEYLTMRALYTFTSLGARFGYTHDQLFKLYSYIAGGFFVFFALLIADLCAKNPVQKLLFFLAQISTALVLIFCGYVEIYATPITLLMLYIYCSLRYIKQKEGFVFAVLALGFAIASHLLCLAAAPSLIIAWYFSNPDKVRFISTWSNKKIALWLSGLILASLIIAIKVKSGFLLTLSAPPSQPTLLTLFDPRHFWEFFNGQILGCGLSFIFSFILLAKSIRRQQKLPGEHYFLLSLSGCFLLLMFMANLQRGSGDWDIMAFPAVSLNLLVIMLVAHLYKNQEETALYLMIAITGLNAVQAFLWLQINHTDRSIHKLEKMLVNDPGTYYTARISGGTQLALAYRNNNLKKETERAALNACNAPGTVDPRPCVIYGTSLKEAGRIEESRLFFEDLLNRTPFVYEAYLNILEYYERKHDRQTFVIYLNRLFDAFTTKPDAFLSSVNFKIPLAVKLFEGLAKYTPQMDQERLKKIDSAINALKSYKPAPQK